MSGIIQIARAFLASQNSISIFLSFVLPVFVVVLFPEIKVNNLFMAFSVFLLFLINSAVIILRLKADVEAIKQTLIYVFFLLLIAVAGMVALFAGLIGVPYANLVANYLSMVFVVNVALVLRSIYILVKKDIGELKNNL